MRWTSNRRLPFAGPTGVLLIALLGSVLAATPREIQNKYGEHSRGHNSETRMADILFKSEIIPRYGRLSSYYTGAFFLGFAFQSGILVAMSVAFLEIAYLFLAYHIGQAVAGKHGGYEGRALYGMMNWHSVLSNRGAVGGDYFILEFVVIILLAAGTGNWLSHAFPVIRWNRRAIVHARESKGYIAQHLRLVDAREHFSYDEGRCCGMPVSLLRQRGAPGTTATELQEVEKQPSLATNPSDPATSGCCAVSPGQTVAGGILLEVLGIYCALRIATGVLPSVGSSPEWGWLALGALVLLYLYLLIFWQMYLKKETIDGPDAKTSVWERYVAKVITVTLVFIFVLLFQLVMQSAYTAMDRGGQFRCIQFSLDADEGIGYAKRNIRLEFAVGVSTTFALLVATPFVMWMGDYSPPKAGPST